MLFLRTWHSPQKIHFSSRSALASGSANSHRVFWGQLRRERQRETRVKGEGLTDCTREERDETEERKERKIEIMVRDERKSKIEKRQK